MLPVALAIGSMLASSAGAAAGQAATKDGAKAQMEMNQSAIDKRREIQDDLTLRNQPYYDQGISQLPGILAMSRNPDFDATGSEFGDKYSQGVKGMTLSAMAGGGRNLTPNNEFMGQLNASEQGRLLNRRLDQLKIGYGQAGTAGNSLQATGSAIADIGQRIGQTQANAQSLQGLNRQQNTNDLMQGASYAPLYLNYKRLNAGE